MLDRVVLWKFTDISEVFAVSIIRAMSKRRAKKLSRFSKRDYLVALMMEAVSNSETLVNFYETTRRNIPEDCHLQVVQSLQLIHLFGSTLLADMFRTYWFTL
jgi:hypothetical protein